MADGNGTCFFMRLLLGFLVALLILAAPSPFGVREVRLDRYDGTDIVIVASGTGSNMEIETNNLALAERREWVEKLSSLIAEIRLANSGELI